GAQQGAFNAGQTNLGNFAGLGALGGNSLANYFTNFTSPWGPMGNAGNNFPITQQTPATASEVAGTYMLSGLMAAGVKPAATGDATHTGLGGGGGKGGITPNS